MSTDASSNESADAPQAPQAPKWRPLNRNQRRVLGVLVEKAKTTPNNYPLSLNGIMTGSNQKSNRDPQMSLDEDDIEQALDELRSMGAISEVHGGGRVTKYRHYMKDWLAVDGTELAVITELMLRGKQTVGELRGRAARMAGSSLPDMSTLKPVLQNLIAKGLVIEVTPAGRGQIVTHALYTDSELKIEMGGTNRPTPQPAAVSSPAAVATPAPAASETVTSAPAAAAAPTATESSDGDLRQEVAELRAEVFRLKKEIEDIWANIS